ncbi:hypothetical protein GDO78_015373 [Eleutherodactylus coqui]|uniref:Olfactory receptor n=1 Tax=Eleutherodactylus coqui TaxID=57060 RepID=A0A8J6EDU9_ELECQ|nr:hypothetical protein GDO78_015373 [Eleutherodactylus coqui]
MSVIMSGLVYPNIKASQTNNITFIFLLGFSNTQDFSFLFFSLLVIIYIATILENLLIIFFYVVSKTLQSAMYFFISQISLCDILVVTDIVPILLHTVLHGRSSMTLIGCIFQFCLFATSEFSECLLLSVMSYDRYLAIYNPLRYHCVMNHQFCVALSSLTWLVAFMVTSLYAISISNLYFCGPHIIDHFYCDLEPILQLSCSDISRVHKQNLIIGVLTGFCPFIVIVTSYVCIVITIIKIPSSTGRHKAFSTCSSHLIVVSILYGALIFVYMFPTKGQSMMSLSYTIVTPLLNPIIYTLRNKDFKEAFYKIYHSF